MTDALTRALDLLAELQFSDVQLMVMRSSCATHLTRDAGLRIAALHRRLDTLERQLRACARELGEDESLALADLRCRLMTRDRRQSPLEPTAVKTATPS